MLMEFIPSSVTWARIWYTKPACIIELHDGESSSTRPGVHTGYPWSPPPPPPPPGGYTFIMLLGAYNWLKGCNVIGKLYIHNKPCIIDAYTFQFGLEDILVHCCSELQTNLQMYKGTQHELYIHTVSLLYNLKRGFRGKCGNLSVLPPMVFEHSFTQHFRSIPGTLIKNCVDVTLPITLWRALVHLSDIHAA